MIITEKLLTATADVLADARSSDADLIIHCNSDGMFVGKIFQEKRLVLSTSKEVTFKQALMKIMELCAKEIGELE